MLQSWKIWCEILACENVTPYGRTVMYCVIIYMYMHIEIKFIAGKQVDSIVKTLFLSHNSALFMFSSVPLAIGRQVLANTRLPSLVGHYI